MSVCISEIVWCSTVSKAIRLFGSCVRADILHVESRISTVKPVTVTRKAGIVFVTTLRHTDTAMLINVYGPTQNETTPSTRALMLTPPAAAGNYAKAIINGWPVIESFAGEDASADLLLADMSHLPKAVVSGAALSDIGNINVVGKCLQDDLRIVGIRAPNQGLLIELGDPKTQIWPEADYADITDGIAVIAVWGRRAVAVVSSLFSIDVSRPDLNTPVFTTAASHGFSIDAFRLNKAIPGFLLTCERSHAHNLYEICLSAGAEDNFSMAGTNLCNDWLESTDRPARVNRTPVHDLQEAAGGVSATFGAWERIVHFGDPEGEAMAAHEGGIIMDSSSFGKFWVGGPDAAKVISRVATKNVENLEVGKVAHYVSCGEEGNVRDDGAIIRRSDTEYYLTTGTLKAAEFEAWCERWCKDESWDYTISNLTQTYSVITFASPHAREILALLTDADISNGALPFMHAMDAVVADVPCMLLRVGFLGELGYELHMPSGQAEHIWNVLMQAGEPFGVKMTAILGMSHLRLEKGHVLPGHDIDANTNLFEAGLGFAWDRSNEGFVGEEALKALEHQPRKRRLVRFKVDGRSSITPSSVMIADGDPVGRMPSVHYSQILDQTIGISLAEARDDLVVADKAKVQTDDGIVEVDVIKTHAFFDTEGARMKA